MARPERFELPTSWFVARHSIQLSYGRAYKAGLFYQRNQQFTNPLTTADTSSPARTGTVRRFGGAHPTTLGITDLNRPSGTGFSFTASRYRAENPQSKRGYS